MNDLVKEYMETGKDLNTICNDRIKANNRSWFLIVILFSVVWIGYVTVSQKRYKQAVDAHSKCDSVHKIDKLKIEMQKNALDSAVYFKDIK